MKRLIIFISLFVCFDLFSQKKFDLHSPDGKLTFLLHVSSNGIQYNIIFRSKTLIENSSLGFNFNSGEFGPNLKVGKILRQNIDENYELVTGKVRFACDYCNQMVIPLEEKDSLGRMVNLIVRAYNEGIAFRYEFPKQKEWNSYVMYDEKTEFRMKGNPRILLMYLPGYVSPHEGLYYDTNYDRIRNDVLIDMPVTLEFDNNTYLSITEAAILNYAGMDLIKRGDKLKAQLSPRLGQEKVKVIIHNFPHKTPWRVISVSNRIEKLIESTILTSLNEPCKIKDTSWIRSYSTTFPWWNGNVVPDTTFSPGNNFATNKYYIDFATRNGINLHNIYGYAETPWYYDDNFNFGVSGPNADVMRPIPSLDMQHICEYAKSVGVGLHLWVNWRPLYDKLEEAFSKFHEWGVKGLMIDFMDRDDQEMINIQEEFLKMAAKYQLFVQFHGSSKPSGLIRTYPNEFTREGTLNYEVYKWDTIVNANHDISIPFTRMLAGSTDYHLGGFRSLPRNKFKIQYVNPFVTSTRCHMLAMYIVLENNLVSLCDQPKAYEGQAGFEILKLIPGDWDDIKVTNVQFNEYISIARRKNDDWWVGAITNDIPRDLVLSLNFLDKNNLYEAFIYTDATDTSENPNKLVFEKRKVTSKDIIQLKLNSEGGSIIRFVKLNNEKSPNQGYMN